jgi:apolipoprotein N-acyltransferase
MKIPAIIWSVLGAVMLWLCWPPFATGFLLPFAFVPWLILVEKLKIEGKLSQAKWYIMLGVFIWNLFCTWWVWYASPEGAIFMLAANTLLMTLFWGFYIWAKRKGNDFWASLTFIGSWLTFEFMHLNWEGNFPWLNLGNGFSANPKLIQWYEFTGTLGGSLWVLL